MESIISRPSNQAFRDGMDRIFGNKEKSKKGSIIYENGALTIIKDPIGLGGFKFDFSCGRVKKALFITDEQFKAMCEAKGILLKNERKL